MGGAERTCSLERATAELRRCLCSLVSVPPPLLVLLFYFELKSHPGA